MNTIGRRHSEVLAICRGGNAIGGTGRRPIVLPVEARQPRRPDTLSGRARSEDQTPKDLHDTLIPGRPQASQHCLGIRRHAASDIGFGPDDPLSPATRLAQDEDRSFAAAALGRTPWRTTGPIRQIFRDPSPPPAAPKPRSRSIWTINPPKECPIRTGCSGKSRICFSK